MRRTTYQQGRAGSGCSCCNSGDRGPLPYTVNVSQAAHDNTAFRSALWTGGHMQMTLMSIPVREDIGVEMHPDTDQYIRVEDGQAIVRTGSCRDRLENQCSLTIGDAVFVPAGTWHNIINTGCCPLKLSSVYAPPHHPRCTLHQTKQDAECASH